MGRRTVTRKWWLTAPCVFGHLCVCVCVYAFVIFMNFFLHFSLLFVPVLFRIKTNGSLPRNETRRSVQSPNGTAAAGRNLNTSEDELSGIFTFDPTPNSVPASPSLSNHQTVTADTAISCKSPYENVCMPQSPRTRIRTTFGKNKEDSPESLSTNQHTYQLITSGVAAEVFSVCSSLKQTDKLTEFF